MKPLTIAVDFDGTIVEHQYPEIGQLVPGAIKTLHELQDEGHRLIMWTMRSGVPFIDAQELLKSMGLDCYGWNENPQQQSWTRSPKAYAHIYIDDAALGCPLRPGIQGSRPMVDWAAVRKLLQQRGLLTAVPA